MRFEICPNCGSHEIKPLEEVDHDEPYAYECRNGICEYEWKAKADIYFTFWARCIDKEVLERLVELARRKELPGSENAKVEDDSPGGFISGMEELKTTATSFLVRLDFPWKSKDELVEQWMDASFEVFDNIEINFDLDFPNGRWAGEPTRTDVELSKAIDILLKRGMYSPQFRDS